MISQDFINNKIPEEARHYLPVSSIELPDTCSESVNALIEAINIISSKIDLNRKVHLVIAKSPFKIPFNSGELSFVSKEETYHAAIENFVFLDFEKLSFVPYPLKVACVLEELAHALMNIADEVLVPQVVALMYPGIALNEQGQYVIP